MALDPAVADLLVLDGLGGLRECARLTGMADRNATQGLTVVNTNLIHTHGGTTDDAATMAALRSARIVPSPDS